MGCNQSRKDYSFSEEEVKKLKFLFLKTANSYTDTKNKNELNVKAFRDLFPENKILGERLHEFMLKNSTNGKVDFEIFIDVLELILRKPTNKSLGDAYLKHDKIGLICAILFPHMRKGFKKQYYSEGMDVVLCVLHMLNGSPNQQVNDSLARTIVDRVFQSNDQFWTFGVLIKEQMNLISSFIHIYFKNKFIDGTVSFQLPSMPDESKQVLIKQDQMLQIYLNNQYLLNSTQIKILYQATQDDYNFDSLASSLQNFVGETFITLEFKDSKGAKYIVGGFNPLKWGQLGNDSVESYIFSLSPRYRHYYPVLDQTHSKPVYNQFCFLNTQESYGRQTGLVFGLNHEDYRIWIDGKSLKNSAVKDSEKFFKKGNLIPPNAENPVCTMIEVYGVLSDQSKKTFTYSTINNVQLNQIIAGSRELRNSLTMGIDPNRSSYVAANKSPYSGSNYQTTTTTYKTETFEDKVKKSAAPSSNNVNNNNNINYTNNYNYTNNINTPSNTNNINSTKNSNINFTAEIKNNETFLPPPIQSINDIKQTDSVYPAQANTTTTTTYSSYSAPQTNYTSTNGGVPDYKSMYVPSQNYNYTPYEGRYSSTQQPTQYTYTTTTQERKTTVN